MEVFSLSPFYGGVIDGGDVGWLGRGREGGRREARRTMMMSTTDSRRGKRFLFVAGF